MEASRVGSPRNWTQSGVITAPGLMVFTRTPLGASSRATQRAKWLSAAFDALYAVPVTPRWFSEARPIGKLIRA